MTRPPIYPILFAGYPILFVFAHNRGQVRWSDLWLPLACGLVGGSMLWLGAWWRLRDGPRAAALTALVLGLFYAYGTLASAVSFSAGTALATSVAPLLLAWLALVVASSALFLRWSRSRQALLAGLVPAFDLAACALIALVAVQLVYSGGLPRGGVEEKAIASKSVPGSLPDIYYIVLDGYGASKTLREIYDVDDRGFLDALRQRGFYIAPDSYANYPRTIHSLTSSLNMGYLRPATRQLAESDGDFTPLVLGLRNNQVMQTLESHGYRIYSFESGYAVTDFSWMPHYRSAGMTVGEYERTLLNLTPIPDLLALLPTPGLYELHRRRILFTFEDLPRVAAESGPKFVFAHVLAPHPPFVFDAVGDPVENEHPFEFYDGRHFLMRQTRDEYIEGYAGQARFVAKKVLEAIDGILAASATPPVIVLQGDHGPGLGLHHESLARTDVIERAFILNAYLTPDPEARARLYETISPVNSFRLLLDHHLGVALPLLPERSFYVRESRPYELTEITRRLERSRVKRRSPPAKAPRVRGAPVRGGSGADG